MKHKLLVYLLLAFFTFPLFAQETDLESKYETIENNLIAGVKSDNLGLRVSAAYFLGEINSNRAVIPLMHMLKNSDIEEERLVAALSRESSLMTVKGCKECVRSFIMIISLII